jgi:multiple sugar transport system substrate-binding protein
MSLVASLGGNMMNADESRLTFDDDAGLAALGIYDSFGRAGQNRLDMGREQARQAFSGGAIALLIDSSSSLERLNKQIGGRFPLATARLPIASNGQLSANGIAAVVCSRDPIRQAAAWQFVKFVCGPVGQNIIGRSTGYVPANERVVRDPALLGDYYRARPLVQPVIESLPYAAPWYAFPGGNSMKIDAVLRDGVTSVVTLEKTTREAAVAMRRTIEHLLPQRAG